MSEHKTTRQRTPREAHQEARDRAVWEAEGWLAEWRRTQDPADLERASGALMRASANAIYAARHP